MEGLLLCAGVLAVLMRLGALIEAARPRDGGRGWCPVTRTGGAVTTHGSAAIHRRAKSGGTFMGTPQQPRGRKRWGGLPTGRALLGRAPSIRAAGGDTSTSCSEGTPVAASARRGPPGAARPLTCRRYGPSSSRGDADDLVDVWEGGVVMKASTIAIIVGCVLTAFVSSPATTHAIVITFTNILKLRGHSQPLQ
jgi:hypothetical protein